MLFLFRKTYGYRKSADRVSFAQLERGTRSSEGTIIDRGTGLSKATIWRALKGLERKGLIEVYRQTTAAGDADVNYYRIREAEPREGLGRSGSDDSPPPDDPSSSADRRGAPSPSQSGGSSHSETTPVSKRNDPRFRTKRPGGFTSETTREQFTRDDSTRQEYTLLAPITGLAAQFLQSIGYRRPARAKSERTVQILHELATREHYDLDDLRAACAVAVSMGARGPELIPHVIGKTPPVSEEVGERFGQAQKEDRRRWQALTEAFDALPRDRQEDLLVQAQQSNRVLTHRSLDHPLVKATAIGSLAREE